MTPITHQCEQERRTARKAKAKREHATAVEEWELLLLRPSAFFEPDGYGRPAWYAKFRSATRQILGDIVFYAWHPAEAVLHILESGECPGRYHLERFQ